jgi:hypothetical protein
MYMFRDVQITSLAKNNQNRMALLQNKYLSGHLDAAVPLRSAETVLQNAIAQRQQRRERVTSAMLVADPSLDCMGMI